MPRVAFDDLQFWGQRTHLWVGLIGHWRRAGHTVLTVCEHWKARGADGLGVGSTVAFVCGATTCPFVQGKEEAEIQSGFCDKVILGLLKQTCLTCTARSPRGRLIEYVILSMKIPQVDHVSALVS